MPLSRARLALVSAALFVAAARAQPPVVAECQAKSPNGPLFITADCVDPVLNQPFIDARKPGSITDPGSGVTVNFLYIHGGFTGTKAKFAFYFPPAEKYRGRFFETTYPTIGEEEAAPGCPQIGTSACSVAFAISNGAYAVSTNNAGGVPAGGAVAAYRTNAAAAKYSRVVAAEIYGAATGRPRGYLYGASGGAYQTVGSMENTSGVWDGGVPMVFGTPNAIPNFMASQLLALRVLRDKLPQIADAVAPGGSGNPYAGLNPEQAAVLKEVTRLGFPLRGWWQYATMNGGGFWAVQGAARAIDGSYMEDFWSKPGYAGSSEPSVQAARIRHETSVTGLASAENELILSNLPAAGDLLYADLIIASGPKAGQSTLIMNRNGNRVKVLSSAGITPGTAVKLDNSWLIALQYYARHQVPTGPREQGWDQYLQPDGSPLYSQRRMRIGPMMNAGSAGSAADGSFHGKMILIESAMDVMAYPWSADWYRKQAAAQSANFRLWYIDNADHGPDLSGFPSGIGFEHAAHAADHIVGYLGAVHQALLDLDAWVAKGIPPPQTSGYRIDADSQVQLAPAAIVRLGVQPVVELGAKTAAVVGKPVTLSMRAQTPPGAGKIVKVEWDFEGSGSFVAGRRPSPMAVQVRVDERHVFTKPGVYFPVVRVTSQRAELAGSPWGLVQNLAGVRVVVVAAK